MGLYKGLKKGATTSHSIKKDELYEIRNSDGKLAVKNGLVKEATAAEFKEFYTEKQKREAAAAPERPKKQKANNTDAEKILADVKADAEKILADVKADANKILADAKADAEKILADVKA